VSVVPFAAADVVLATNAAALPPEPVDRVLIVNTFHHVPNGADYLRALAGRLREGVRPCPRGLGSSSRSSATTT
jgi:hypothetical protein